MNHDKFKGFGPNADPGLPEVDDARKRKTTERYTHSFQEQKKRAVETLAEKSESKLENREDLLHIRYTKKTGQKENELLSLFSVN